jgi:hypothetical protein
LPEKNAYLKRPPDIWSCFSDILLRKNAKMPPGYLNMSPRHLTSTRRNVARCLSDILICFPDILTCRPDIVQFFCIIRSGGTVEGGKT